MIYSATSFEPVLDLLRSSFPSTTTYPYFLFFSLSKSTFFLFQEGDLTLLKEGYHIVKQILSSINGLNLSVKASTFLFSSANSSSPLFSFFALCFRETNVFCSLIHNHNHHPLLLWFSLLDGFR